MSDTQFILPPKVTDLSIVPEELRDFYRQSNEGAYYVRIDPKKLTGSGEEQRRNLQAMISENERLKASLGKYEHIDMEQYEALMSKREEIMTAEAVKSGEIETIRKSIESAAIEKIKAAERDRDAAISLSTAERINAEFDKAFERAGVVEDETMRRLMRKDLMDYIVPVVDIQARRVDYEIRDITPGPTGHRDQLLNDGGKAMRLSDLVNSRRSLMPWFFGGTLADGGGQSGGAPPAQMTAGQLEGKRIVDMNPAEQAALYNRIKAPAYFQRLRNETAAAQRARRQ